MSIVFLETIIISINLIKDRDFKGHLIPDLITMLLIPTKLDMVNDGPNCIYFLGVKIFNTLSTRTKLIRQEKHHCMTLYKENSSRSNCSDH